MIIPLKHRQKTAQLHPQYLQHDHILSILPTSKTLISRFPLTIERNPKTLTPTIDGEDLLIPPYLDVLAQRVAGV